MKYLLVLVVLLNGCISINRCNEQKNAAVSFWQKKEALDVDLLKRTCSANVCGQAMDDYLLTMKADGTSPVKIPPECQSK